jgi:hypothetical protein
VRSKNAEVKPVSDPGFTSAFLLLTSDFSPDFPQAILEYTALQELINSPGKRQS